MNLEGQKDGYFNSDDVSMMGHGCALFRFPQFYYDTFKF